MQSIPNAHARTDVGYHIVLIWNVPPMLIFRQFCTYSALTTELSIEHVLNLSLLAYLATVVSFDMFLLSFSVIGFQE